MRLPQLPSRAPGREGRGIAAAARCVGAAACIGAGIGFVLELVAQPLVHLHDAQTAVLALDLPWARLILVPPITAVLLGALAAFATALVAWLGRFRFGRSVAALFVACVLTIALALHAMGLVVRYASGIYPTVGAAALLFESPVHFLDQALESFPGGLRYLAIGSTLSVLVLASLLGRAFERAWRVDRRWPYGMAAASLGGVALLGLPPVVTQLLDHDVQSTEIALYASMLESMEDEAAADEPAPKTIEGAKVREGMAYRERLQGIGRARRGELPNVLLLVLESVPARHTGFGGYDRPVTPNLDRIAAESLRMRRVWTTSTHSNYAQMAILSSLFPRRQGSLDVYRRLDYPRALPQDLLRPLGYDTATISSQNEDWQGMRRFQSTRTPHYFFDSHDFHGRKIGRSSDGKLYDQDTIDEAIRWLGEPRSGPFYLYVNLQATHYSYHYPTSAPPPFPAPSIRSLRDRGFTVSYMAIDPGARPAMRDHYDNALHYQDAQIGRLVEALEARGLYDDTLLVVTADHGESFGEAGVVTHGKTLREPEARPPLLVRYPGRVDARDVDLPVSHLDIMPTVLDLLGLPPYPGYQGRSFVDARAYAKERRGIFLTMQGIRYMDAVVCYPWKLVDDRSGRRVHLYDLEHDPAERRDQFAIRPRIARALHRLLRAQIAAQLAYHRVRHVGPDTRFQPRIMRCPELRR
jgi:arylsulfatase A-like enzyme